MNTSSEILLKSPAIKALGPLFNLTEIFIWDDGYSSDNQQSALPKHIRFKYDDDDDDDDGGDSNGKNGSNAGLENAGEDRILVENAVVTEEMSALGLPLSFQTNRQRKGGQIKGKSKGVLKNRNNQKSLDEPVEESSKPNEERPYHTDFQVKSSNSSSTSFPDQSEHSGGGSDVTYGTLRESNFCERHVPIDMDAVLISDGLDGDFHDSSPHILPIESVNDDLVGVDLQMEIEMMNVDDGSNLPAANTSSGSNVLDDHLEDDVNLTEQLNTQRSLMASSIMQPENSGSAIIEQPEVSDLSKDSQNMVALDQGYSDFGNCYNTCGDWSAYWDDFYLRYYFYNAQTKESTWYTPSGMESFAAGESCCSFDESNMGLPGNDAALSIDQSEAQSDYYGLADKTGLHDGIETQGGGELPGGDLTPDFATSSMRTYTVEHSHMSENETKKKVSGDVSNDSLESKESVSVCSPCRNTGLNCNDNSLVQLSNESSLTCAVDAVCDDDITNIMHLEEGDTVADHLHILDASAGTKQTPKRKHRRKKSFNRSEANQSYQGEEIYIDIRRYWRQRYLLFSRFDDGIKMDNEGWFSVTPEAIARHQASRCGGGTIIDCFTGAGGNAIQFAKTSKHVIAIDIDPNKIYYARHNAAIYGVEDNIDFITGDSLNLASKLKADAVFLSPPWGGPDYVQCESYSLHMLQPYDGRFLFDTYRVSSPMVIMFLPRNINIEELAELALSTDPPWSLEVEKNFLNGRFKAVTAYFSRTSV